MGIWAFIILSFLFLWKCEAFYNKNVSPNSCEFSLIGFPRHIFWYGVGWRKSGKKLSIGQVDQQRLPGGRTATLILKEVGTVGECAFWIQHGKGFANCRVLQKYCIVWWKNIFKILTFFFLHSLPLPFFFFLPHSVTPAYVLSVRRKSLTEEKRTKGVFSWLSDVKSRGLRRTEKK